MRVQLNRSDRLLKALAAAAACAIVAGCATGSSEASSGPAGVFKVPVGEISGAVAPGPHSAWYVQRQPVHYVKVGMASWRAEPVHSGFTAWLARLFHRKAAGAGAPTALTAASTNLPVPSIVQVTNVASGETVTVRVEDRAALRDSIISLGAQAARQLGADPAKPLLVRVRYVEPAIAYRETPTLRYALGGGRRPAASPPAPPAQPPVVMAEAPRPQTPLPPAPKAAEVIKVAQTGPVIRPTAEPAPSLRTTMQPEPAAPHAAPAAEPPAGPWRIQAGAFAKEANARRAVAMLAPAGTATIEPMKRGALTLYRVVLHGAKDERAAKALRAKVAAIGFTDAEVIRSL